MILANSKKVVFVKPALNYQQNHSDFEGLFRSAMDFKNYVLSEGILVKEPIVPKEELGMFELCQEVGTFRKNQTDSQIYFHQSGENKYKGTINLLAEVLYNKSCPSQDLGIMVPGIDDEGKVKELSGLIDIIIKINGYAAIKIIREDYPDFALFFERIAKHLNLTSILSEISIDEAIRQREVYKKYFSDNDPELVGNNIEIGTRNSKVLQLAKILPDYMEE